MKLKLLATALILGSALALALPILAETTATISGTPPADACGTAATTTDGSTSAPAADCPAAKPGKLGSNIIPLAGSDEDSEGEDEGGDND
jgi:hypothetical protein